MKTAAVIITYNPDSQIVDRIKAIARECQWAFIVDNGSNAECLKILKKTKATLVQLGQNTGIAHAQNVGLKLAFEKKADGVILFDHDSTPRKGFTAALWQAYQAGGNPTIVGAQIHDIHTQQFSKYPTYAGPFFRRRFCEPGTVLHGAMLAIASGCLISRQVYERVGGMQSSLFIDYVDWEYCLRARQRHGIPTIICGGAVLEHARGERKARRFWGLTVRPPGYSLFRYRYIYRNRALLLRRYFFRIPSFVAFEVLALGRDTLLLLTEELPFRKLFASIGAWFRGFLYTA